MASIAKRPNVAWLAATLLVTSASLGPAKALPIDPVLPAVAPTGIEPAYFYGPGPYYRPYWRPYWRRPFYRRFYYGRRLSPHYFCNNQPSRC